MATATYDASKFDAAKSDLILATLIKPLSSLKLTVALFAAGMVIVFVGTLAQDEQNMLSVKQQYFNSWIARIPFDVFVPQPFYPHNKPLFSIGDTPLWLPFPGGALIGFALLVNLIAAKMVRFHVTAKSTELTIGLVLSAMGIAMIGGLIYFAQAGDGLQGKPPIEYPTLWTCCKLLLLIAAISLSWLGTQMGKYPALKVGLFIVAAIALMTSLAFFSSDWRPDDPSLRILWQLLQSGLAGLPLLIGFVFIFGRRGANALIHFGVALLMLGQFMFGDHQLEQRLMLAEGEATNVLRNLDAIELAIVDRSNPDADQVTSIPVSQLREAAIDKSTIKDPRLPFQIEVIEYFPNSGLSSAEKAEKNLADRGQGKQYVANERPPSGGAKSGMDLASAYIRLQDKQGEELGTYLVSQYFSDWKLLSRRSGQKDENESLNIAGTAYDFGLRFKRIPKPYWIKLDDVRRINYSGSETPRDYSSYIRLVDPTTGEDRQERIWMNNPLRYRGETFYQSSYDQLDDGVESTGIQVVANDGWMIPYISCMLVLIGLVVHFSDTLIRFVGRQQRAKSPDSLTHALKATVPAIAVTSVIVAWLLWPANYGPGGFDFYKAGQIPVSAGGRVMPLDALAQQTLQTATNKTQIKLQESNHVDLSTLDPGRKMPAIQWLMEIAAGEERAEKLLLFRIDAEEVLSELKLIRRKDNRYSVDDLRKSSERLNQLVKDAVEVNRSKPENLSFKQKKLMELDERIRAYTLLAAAFEDMKIPKIPSEADLIDHPDAAIADLSRLKAIVDRVQGLEKMNAPAVIPPAEPDQMDERGNKPAWLPLNSARVKNAVAEVANSNAASPTVQTFDKIIEAYRKADATAFNKAVDKHLIAVAAVGATDYVPQTMRVERWLHAVDPCGLVAGLYTLLVVVTFVGFLIGGDRIRPAVTGTLVVLLIVHTLALGARIYVTGRPPVINLYSSAVFIGWSLVIAGLGLELIFRTGIGNLVAAVAGASTLMVAYGLDSGDTMGVLQAVLDTQFWLSIHVTTVALGYSATFLAGLLGIFYLGVRLFANREATPTWAHDIYRMIYGTVCFGILFSFVGTVLGGLWADDSWGRFWGWDPKENGALLIVLWNALLLHARWDRMVGERGFALLAIGGNIVTAWSWFGTNQLGIGLHSYGFTTGVVLGLAAFVFSQLLIIFLGWLLVPRSTTLPGV